MLRLGYVKSVLRLCKDCVKVKMVKLAQAQTREHIARTYQAPLTAGELQAASWEASCKLSNEAFNTNLT